MPLTPEESQSLTNLQRRILTNTAAGKPITEGIDREEIRKALDLFRGDRAKALAAGVAKAPAKKRASKVKQTESEADAALAAKLAKFKVSLD